MVGDDGVQSEWARNNGSENAIPDSSAPSELKGIDADANVYPELQKSETDTGPPQVGDKTWAKWPPPTPFELPPAFAPAYHQSVMIDPESFARAVALAVAAVLDARPAQTAMQPQFYGQTVPSATRKASFWSGMWHADVLLTLIAVAIIVIILFAWSV